MDLLLAIEDPFSRCLLICTGVLASGALQVKRQDKGENQIKWEQEIEVVELRAYE